ncbi:hypothetical protein A2U01_0093711, partial [Trifolium medium]|nr:hypothetical protein [Trifolium medium]
SQSPIPLQILIPVSDPVPVLFLASDAIPDPFQIPIPVLKPVPVPVSAAFLFHRSLPEQVGWRRAREYPSTLGNKE